MMKGEKQMAYPEGMRAWCKCGHLVGCEREADVAFGALEAAFVVRVVLQANRFGGICRLHGQQSRPSTVNMCQPWRCIGVCS